MNKIKRQHESQRESQLRDYLANYRLTTMSIEGKGSNASVPDVLCITEKGNIFLLELKDGSDYSVGQEYLLLRIRHNFKCEYDNGTFHFYKKSKAGQLELTMENIIARVDGHMTPVPSVLCENRG